MHITVFINENNLKKFLQGSQVGYLLYQPQVDKNDNLAYIQVTVNPEEVDINIKNQTINIKTKSTHGGCGDVDI